MATYRAQQLLGRGGMAEVWRGEMMTQGGASRPVALKFILPHLASDEALLGMFRTEAALSMRLSHGNLVQVFDFGQLEGRWFLAMEWVDGVSLWKVLARAKALGVGALHPVLAAQLLVAVLDGLHHAHTRVGPDGEPLKLVHRDVSPDNVLVSWDGQVKVADFGIARAVLEGRRETEPGVFKGKLAYGAPEQARAEAVDARADVYAAGVMLWELVTGENPTGSDGLRIAAGLARLAPFPAQRIDATFAELVNRAVAADTQHRFPSAKAFRDALTAWLAEQPATLAGPAELMAWLFPEKVTAPELKAAGAETGRWLLQWKGSSPPVPEVRSPPNAAPLRQPTARAVLGILIGAAVGVLGLVALWPSGEPDRQPSIPPPAPPPVRGVAPVAAAAPGPSATEVATAAALRIDSLSGAPALVRLDSAKHSFSVLTHAGVAHHQNGAGVRRAVKLQGSSAGLFYALTDSAQRLVAVRPLAGAIEVPPHQSVHAFAAVSRGASEMADEPGSVRSWVPSGATPVELPNHTAILEEHRFEIRDVGPGWWLLSASPVKGSGVPLGVLAVSEWGVFRVKGGHVVKAVFLQPNTEVEFQGRLLWLSLPVAEGKDQELLDVRLDQAEPPVVDGSEPPLPQEVDTLTPQLVASVVKRNEGGVVLCTQRFRDLLPRVSGEVAVTLRIDASGAVTGAGLETRGLGDALAVCILDAVSGWKFPRNPKLASGLAREEKVTFRYGPLPRQPAARGVR